MLADPRRRDPPCWLRDPSFSHSHSDYPLEIPAFTASSATVIARPPIVLFRHPSTPQHAGAYAKSKAPLVAIHGTTLSNRSDVALLGISVPHTFVDAIGMGMIAKALDAELGGLEWAAPDLPSDADERNWLEVSISESLKFQAGQPEVEDLIMRDFTPATWWTKLAFLVNLAWEYTWHRTEIKIITLGSSVLGNIVESAKREVRTASGGDEYVSTADVLVAWLLKVKPKFF